MHLPGLTKQNVTLLKCHVSFTNRRVPQISTPVAEQQPSSRATRSVDDPTRFLIVSVEDQTRLGPYRPAKNVEDLINDGLLIDGKKYTFLGFTDSQLKSGHMMFFREDEDCTVERFLIECGDLESVYISSGYGKYSARLGLSFSSTAEGLNVPPKLAILIDDVKAGDGTLVTDGIGMITDTFARQLCVHLGIPEDTTVFQIRRGGIKGLLVRYHDDVFWRLCGLQKNSDVRIAYRPSMLKYEGGPTLIEVANISSSASPRARLNHQFTSLLLTLGIPVKVFESLLECHLERINSIATNRERAIDYLSHSVAELDSRGTGLTQELLEILLAGHEMTGHVAARIRTFQDLEYKALLKKLHIDVKDSCWLFGVVDEQGILAEGEVYINLPGRSGVQCRKMVVGRSPAYSPGDIRVLQGVDREELSHLKDCIVFPKNCRRSVPDTMGGGDLDGDRYWVCWDPRLVPDRTERPEERGTPPKTKQTKDVAHMKSDAAQTFATLRGSHILGMMCNSWVSAVEANPAALADDPYARALVPLIETAMDMTKTGTDAEKLKKKFEELQRSRQYTRKRPGDPRSPFDTLRALIPNEPKKLVKEWIVDPVLASHESDVPQWRWHYEDGLDVIKKFNKELAIGIKKDEAEPKDDKKPAGQKHVDVVKNKFADQYFKGRPRDQYDERLRASAWYTLGYNQEKEAFAWLGARYLHRIKAEHAHGGLVISVGPRFKTAKSEQDEPGTTQRAQTTAPLVQCTPVSSRASSLALEPENDVAPQAGPSTIRKISQEDTAPNGAPSEVSDHEMEVDPLSVEEPVLPMASGSRPKTTRATHNVTVHVGVLDVTLDKPMHPVATPTLPGCHRPEHTWSVKAGGAWRHYTCLSCWLLVKEKRLGGSWCPQAIVTQFMVDRRVQGSHSEHVVEPVRSEQSQPQSQPQPPRTDVAMEKPLRPVATVDMPACSGHGGHVWDRKGCIKAGATWRNYKCANCGCVVKEKRKNGIWCPDAVLH